VTLPDGGEGCASSGLVLPHWNGPHRVQPIRRDGRFTRSRSGDCTMKAVIATAQHMAATRMAKRVTGLLLSGSRSSGGTGLRLTSRAIGLARVRGDSLAHHEEAEAFALLALVNQEPIDPDDDEEG